MTDRGNKTDSATYVVELTPAGRGAVAVVAIDGANALAAVQNYFVASSGRVLDRVPLQQIAFGRWGQASGEELVVARRSETHIEVHCHGGLAAVGRIVADLVAAGCQEISWREWLRRRPGDAMIGTSRVPADAISCSAQIALANALTSRTAAILLDQFNGALSRALQAAVAAISQNRWSTAATSIDELIDLREVGLHLTTPWRVAFAGPPNVGKSSLINALAGYERAIVSPTPGTTRDVVTLSTAIGGLPIEFADTAGLRATGDDLEAAGVQLATDTLATADLVLLVGDVSSGNSLSADSEHGLILQLLENPRRMLRVRNKIDLMAASNLSQVLALNTTVGTRDPVVFTSALSGVGIAELATAIGAALVPNPPPAGAAVPFTQRQVESLSVARKAIERRRTDAAQEALQSLLSDS